MVSFRFAAVGDNCIDRFRPPVGQSLIGGNAVNVVVQLARLGQTAFYFGAVGDDADGRRTLDLLAENRVRIDHAETRPGLTAYTDIDVLPSGDRVFIHEDFGVCADYRPSPADLEALKTMDHVHIGWLNDGGALRRALVEAGVSVSQDISVNADRDNLGVDGLTVAFGSAGDDETAAKALLQRFLADGAQTAVVTCGAHGSMARTGDDRAATGIRPVEVVDTTGAGDSFIAGFLKAFVAREALQACLEAGRDHAAQACMHVGGFPQQPRPL